ncbi:MAG: single-stranded DNA-binding protein [Acidobacteriota bacterium]
MNYNRIIIAGHLTRDPELKYNDQGDPFCRFRMAVNPRGAKSESSKPLFIDVLVWKRNSEACRQHLSKGQNVLVDGSLQLREWTDSDQVKRAIIQVFADRVEFGPKRNGSRPAPAAEGLVQDPPVKEGEEVPF